MIKYDIFYLSTFSYYFGASATTGDLSDNHLINSIKFFELDGITTSERQFLTPRASKFEEPREHVSDPKTGWSNLKIFFVLMLGMISAVVLSVCMEAQTEGIVPQTFVFLDRRLYVL